MKFGHIVNIGDKNIRINSNSEVKVIQNKKTNKL